MVEVAAHVVEVALREQCGKGKQDGFGFKSLSAGDGVVIGLAEWPEAECGLVFAVGIGRDGRPVVVAIVAPIFKYDVVAGLDTLQPSVDAFLFAQFVSANADNLVSGF